MSQQDRNRANAQHSTGPKTEEGKAVASQNARKHGLSSTTLFVPPERLEELNSLSDSLWQEIRPMGELQLQFFEQALHASWNLETARRLLAVAFDQMDDRKIANANRYIAQYERSFARALKEIKALQTDLALRAVEQNEPIAALPFTCEVAKITQAATQIARSAERTQQPATRFAILERIGAAFHPEPPLDSPVEPGNSPAKEHKQAA